jgi:cell division protein FtsW
MENIYQENTEKKSIKLNNDSYPEWFESYFKGDKTLWLVIFGMTIVSMLVIYSATGTLAFRNEKSNTYYLFKHLFFSASALLVVWLAHRIDYRYYAKLSRFALLLAVPLLMLTWYFGVNINEANRWITIPIIGGTFQTSDFAKLALISNIATMLAKRQGKVADFQETVLPILIWTGIICMLIGLSNISNAILLFITSFLLMYIGRVPTKQLGLMLGVGIFSIFIALSLGQRGDTAANRLRSYLGYNTDNNFQVEQAYIAVSTGGFFGKGPGNSDQRNFLPNSFSDFIYAIIIEEYGLVGGIVVLGLYLLLLHRGMVIVGNTNYVFGGILAAGLTFSLVGQALLNMSVSVGVAPITGVPLPFISMGGTSLLFTGLALGILLSVSRGEIVDFSVAKQVNNPKSHDKSENIMHKKDQENTFKN